ncbi:sensor histidine kinase [Salana multivorans]|uniref:sensor histidine kinase n=1 Tax=Salana multivorans TaxID=120377 RepID=UPI001B86059E|nr:HAMP domain-containing sensor histidine kinase [Salana multivorans]
MPAVLAAAVAVCGTLVAFLHGTAAGLVTGGVSLALCAILFVHIRLRYARIAELTHQIDIALHQGTDFRFDSLEEGELSVLQSEIHKLLLRVQEQNAALRREKEHLSDSLADIAHQLRTPLTSATITMSLIADQGDPEERRALTRQAEDLLSRMDWLLTSLLKLSRLDAGVVSFQDTSVYVSELIDEAIQPLLVLLDIRDVSWHADIPETASLHGDPRWIGESIRNVLKNCIESAGVGGVIEVGCVETPLYTEITIADNGDGIDQADLPRVFERFYQSKDKHSRGYGIGLALSRTIITRQGGSIVVRNRQTGGAEFVIRFPK